MINVTAQVPSNIYSEKSKAFDFYPQFDKLRTLAPEIIMSGFDINRLLEEDEAAKGMDIPYRFGKGFDVNYSFADGLWTKVNSGSVWLMKVTSPGAYSINFIFNELYLPRGAELYIYSYDGTMVYGPVTSKQNLERGFFLTDVIKGESVIVYLYVPKNKKVNTRLVISRIIHGYKDTFDDLFKSTKGFGDSDTCEVNVACYPAWSDESDAVARTIVGGGSYYCSGSLINNTSKNFRSYFLSAFHCIDVAGGNYSSPDFNDKELQPYEINDAENWAFRFRYKTTSCEGTQIESYYTYNQDYFRAAWDSTDFALVELDDSPLAHQYVSFLGWDNTGSTPTKVTCIHHPKGDVMKISHDSDSPTSEENNTHWLVDDWDIGTTERGSSGGPLFNQDEKVIGQDHKRDEILDPCDPEKGTYFGKFSGSWTGGGGNSTQLSNWLDPCESGASAINTITGAYVTGPDIVCTSNATYTLHNCPTGTTVTWSANSWKVSPSSGTGTSATIHATCNDIGYTRINFTISDACGNGPPIKKEFLVAGPDYSEVKLDVTYSNGQPAPKSGGTFQLCPNTYYYFYVVNNSDCSTSGYKWTLPPSITLVYTYNNMACVYTGSNPGGNVRVKATTCCSGCGSNVLILSDYVGTYWNCGGYYFSMSPNPSDYYVEISIEESKMVENNIDEYEVRIYNSMNIMVYQTKSGESTLRINTRQFINGTYTVHFIAGDKVQVKKLIVSH